MQKNYILIFSIVLIILAASFYNKIINLNNFYKLENDIKYINFLKRNIPYATVSKSQVLDIYFPNSDNNKPSDKLKVLIFVHGGAFLYGDKSNIHTSLRDSALKNNYVVISANHRKSNEAIFPAAVADIKAVVRWVRANSKKYNLDENNITIWGESSGAYLAVMTALTPEVLILNGDVKDNLEYSSKVNNLVSIFGGFDLYTLDKELNELTYTEFINHSADDSPESKFLGQPIMADKEKTYTTYWGTYKNQIPKDYKVKTFIEAGNKDTSIPYTQSEKLANELAKIFGEKYVKYVIIKGANHGAKEFFTKNNINMIFDYLGN